MVSSKIFFGKGSIRLMLIFLLLGVFLVSGQQGCPQIGKDKVETTSQGLEVSFVEEAPPLTASVNQEFPIYVNVFNKGGKYINPGEAKFYLSGVGPNLEGVSQIQSNEKGLVTSREASADTIIFAEKAKFTFPIESLHTLPLLLTSCYTYRTTAQASICVLARNESKICTVGTEKISSTSNSIAPVQITSLKEEVAGNKLRVTFVITNKLNGEVYLPDTNCDKLQKKEDLSEAFKREKIRVELKTTEQGFSCRLLETGPPYVPLDGLKGNAGLGTVLCEKELSGFEGSLSPFTISLEYKYVDSKLHTMNIVP